MLIRRLYSSCSRSAPSTETAVKHTPTRGRLRVKPSRVSQSQTLSKLTRPRSNAVANDLLKSLSLQSGGRGRKGRRAWMQKTRTVVVITDSDGQLPAFIDGRLGRGVGSGSGATDEFSPVHLYPAQAAMHLAFTPPHLPLPVNLGSRIYTSPSTTPNSPFDPETLFIRPSRPSPVPELSRKSDNALGDHQNVLSALSHPVNAHHIGGAGFFASNLKSEGDGDTMLARMIAEAGVKWRVSPEAEWERTLSKLSSRTSTPSSAGSPEQSGRTETQTESEVRASAITSADSVQNAVVGLDALLEKLRMDDEKVDMTSVKRKRKQKISKHKYKKRRKAERAQRKRLGK